MGWNCTLLAAQGRNWTEFKHYNNMKQVSKILASLVIIGLSLGNVFAQTHPPLGGGSGIASDPYLISTPAHLAELADYVNANNSTAAVHYKVMNDLDLSGYDNWTPIGTGYAWDEDMFKGNFNGNGKRVQNLTVNRPTEEGAGLFGFVRGAVIENLGVEKCNVKGEANAGGLAGYVEANTTIANCYTTGSVSVKAEGGLQGGGLVGMSVESVITGCFSTCDVNGGYVLGGLVGDNSTGVIKNCYATGNVVTETESGGYYGGLAGANTSGTIEHCYATGNVTGRVNTGGLVGGHHHASGNIRNCVAANTSIAQSSTNTTDINRVVGGGAASETFKNNYANDAMTVQANGVNVNIDPNINGADGANVTITTLQSADFYTNTAHWSETWDFTNIWYICNGNGLPFLRWQGASCTYIIEATTDDNGNITPSGSITVTEGDNITFTFTPNVGYAIETVLIDGVNDPVAVSSGSYTFENVTEDHAIHVTFVYGTGIAPPSPPEGGDVRVYPNPTNGTLTITCNRHCGLDPQSPENNEIAGQARNDIRNVEVFDVMGRTVMVAAAAAVETHGRASLQSQIANHTSHITFDLSNVPSGIYFLKIQTADGVVTRKVVKQ